MKDLVANHLRALHRKIQQADRRHGLVDIAGKVKPGSQDMDKRTVRLVIGQSSDGQDVLSPPVRWQATGAGALKMHAVPADNEQMTLHSPSGTVGSGSLAHWGTYDQDNPPPSQSKDESVIQFGGKAQITFGKDSLRLSFGTDSYVDVAEKTILVRVPDGGTVKLGKEADKGQTDPVKTVTGQSESVQAKTG